MRIFSWRRLFGCLALILSFTVPFLAPDKAAASFKITEDAFSISNAPGYCFAMARLLDGIISCIRENRR